MSGKSIVAKNPKSLDEYEAALKAAGLTTVRTQLFTDEIGVKLNGCTYGCVSDWRKKDGVKMSGHVTINPRFADVLKRAFGKL